MTNPKTPEKGRLIWLTGYWVRVVFPISVFTGISLWISFARRKPPTPPTNLAASITEVLEQEEETEERYETALLEGAEMGDEKLIEDRDPIEIAIQVME